MSHLSTFSFSLLAATTFLSGIAKSQETCTTAPTCLELGYTLTSTTNCVGTPLKCPFDKTKYYCAQKDDVTKSLSPNYSKKYRLANNVNYTVGSQTLTAYSCLWVQFYSGGVSRVPGSDYTRWYINESEVGATDSQFTDYIMGFYPLYRGDTFRLRSGMKDGNDILYYYPCKEG